MQSKGTKSGSAYSIGVDGVCSSPSCPSTIGAKPSLYPSHIIPGTGDHHAEFVVSPSDGALSPAFRITLPNGIKIG